MNPTSAAFADLQRNLEYARELVGGGRYLEGLQASSFDVRDLYRAALVQAVASLDHWVHEEIYHRAVTLALQPDGPKPAKFGAMDLPMTIFDSVHYAGQPLDAAFDAHLRRKLGYVSYQNPDRIKEGFALVSDIQLWPTVAKVLSGAAKAASVTAAEVRGQLIDIVRRRNQIAHEADRDPGPPTGRKPITAAEATGAIDHLEGLAAAIVLALNGTSSQADAHR